MTDRTRVVITICLGTPVAVLAGSYVWLALDHGTVWLWSVVVHESGRYTFGETVLYPGHFLREVPVVVTYAMFLLGTSGCVATDRASGEHVGLRLPPVEPRSRGGTAWFAAALLLVVWAFLAATRADGSGSAVLDLVQYRTRDDLVGYGTHWRYHWLSTVWFGAAVAAAPPLLRSLTGEPALRSHRGWSLAAWGYFLALTLLFGLSPDIFVDVRYAGHQAREILTHGPTTLLGGLGLILVLGRRGRRGATSPAPDGPRESERAPSRTRGRHATVSLSLAAMVLILLHLTVVALSGDVMEQGQSELGLAAMVAGHWFEHSLDYLLTFFLLMGGLDRARA